jgi:hypothetical protein
MVVLREKIIPIAKFYEAKKKGDGFLNKVISDQLKIEDLVGVLPREEKFDKLRYGLIIVDGLKDKDKEME